MDARPASLCVALDGSDRPWLVATAAALATTVPWLKIGLEAFVAHGTGLVEDILTSSSQVFLDLKLHDIPATVERAAANCAASGAQLLTVHAGGGRPMLRAAMEGAHRGAAHRPPRVVAVTLLTSLDADELAELGIEGSAEEVVDRWTELALECGVDGVVCSAREAGRLRRKWGDGPLLVTPGIRPAGAVAADQRRVVTPAEAVTAGADILVVGRPITAAAEPTAAARQIIEEMEAAARTTGS